MNVRRSLLAAWADLAPKPDVGVPLQVAHREEFLWLGTQWSLFTRGRATTLSLPSSWHAKRLAQLDAMHPDAHVLREGWIFLAGSVERDGVRQCVLHPLLSRPVRLRSESTAMKVARTLLDGTSGNFGITSSSTTVTNMVLTCDGDADLTPLIDDLGLRDRIAESAEFGRGALTNEASPALVARMPALWQWINRAARATQLELEPNAKHLIETRDPWTFLADATNVRIVVGGAVYAAPEQPRPVLASALLAWSMAPNTDRTSFETLYGDASGAEAPQRPPDPRSPTDDPEVESAFALSPSQERVVRVARTRPLTVVSGAPGNGKSHAVAAIALDHVARGQSVLIATRSRFAARAIAELIHRVPGPNALRFGDIIEGSSVVDELNDVLVERTVDDHDHGLGPALVRRDSLRTALHGALSLEALASDVPSSVSAMRVLAPRAFDLESDLDALDELVDAATRHRSGLFAHARADHALDELSEAVGAPVTDPTAIRVAIDRARRRRAALILAADGGTRLAAEWAALTDAEEEVRHAVGLASRQRQDSSRRARGAVSQLLAALRAGRVKRRLLLADIDADALTAAVPLWIGTLADIEDLLPARASTFDLVILDEAAHIDQPTAAPALLRAERAVIVGDPHQLRHVSFLADDAITSAFADHGIAPLAPELDLRRNSIFDRAAAITPIQELREHYRSVPHLVAFPLAEFYRDSVDVMTRCPANDALDVIDVFTPEATDRAAEVDAVLRLLDGLNGDIGTVGVITPFRAHADVLQRAVMDRFDEDRIRSLGLRVSTVHGFQGAERDLMILALGLSPDDPSGRFGFIENRNLFNVMVTRARDRSVIVTSADHRHHGLLARYLAHASRAPTPLPDEGSRDAWTTSLATELGRAGLVTRLGYRVGPWTLDLVVGDGEAATVLETRVESNDPDRHIDRHQALARLGWTFVDAYPSGWDHDVARASLDLVADLSARHA